MKPLLINAVIVIFALPAEVARAQSAAAAVILERIAIVDDSGSMAGERITIVKRELVNLLKQLPPSPRHPFTLITFGSQAAPPKTFTDLKAAEAAIGQLRGGSGGTNIAGALGRAAEYLNSHRDAAEAIILFYSDGEDANQKGILEQEAVLDARFAEREQRGLSQTVVFCKRWGNSNAVLREAIERRGRARVIDAGEAALQPLTIHPDVTVRNVRRLADDPQTLEIEVAVACPVKGTLPKGFSGSARFACLNADIEGDVAVTCPIGGAPPRPHRLRLKIPGDKRTARTLDLRFSVEPPKLETNGSELVMPLLSATQLTVPVAIPERILRNRITVRVQEAPGKRWVDPLRLAIAAPLLLTFDVEPVEEVPGQQSPATFRIVAGDGTRILAGNTVLELAPKGRTAVSLTLGLRPADATKPLSELRFPFALRVEPVSAPSGVEFEPPRLDLHQPELWPPPPVTTTIRGTVESVSTAAWTDVVNGFAYAEVQTRFVVDGPIPPGTTISLVAPSTVQHLEIRPQVLSSGENRVLLAMTAQMVPFRESRLQFRIVPPADAGAVQFQAGPSLDVAVTGPQPARLIATERGKFATGFQATAADNAAAIHLPVTPVLIGIPPDSQSHLAARLMSQMADMQPVQPESLPLSQTTWTTFRAPQPKERPFFEDLRLEGTVELLPATPAAAVEGSQYRLVVRMLAPFKRLAFQIAISLSVLLAAVLVIRMYLRLRQTE